MVTEKKKKSYTDPVVTRMMNITGAAILAMFAITFASSRQQHQREERMRQNEIARIRHEALTLQQMLLTDPDKFIKLMPAELAKQDLETLKDAAKVARLLHKDLNGDPDQVLFGITLEEQDGSRHKLPVRVRDIEHFAKLIDAMRAPGFTNKILNRNSESQPGVPGY